MKEEDNKIDIDLAYRTQNFIDQMTSHELQSIPRNKLRNLIANLCDFETRFARPMVLPFELGSDLENGLEAPRAISALKNYDLLFALPADAQVDVLDKVTIDGISFGIVGSDFWKTEVAKGMLSGKVAEPVDLSATSWICDLFDVLALADEFSFERKHIARRLASCWYFVASQVDYSARNEEEDALNQGELEDFVGQLANEVLEAVGAGLVGAENGELEENAEDEEDDQPPPLVKLSDVISDDLPESDEEEDDDYNPDMDVDDEEDSDEDMDEDEYDEDDEFIPTQEELDTRAKIFGVVETLDAYMPSPDEDLPWFKRVLKDVRASQGDGDMTWYPWGAPPIEPLVGTLRTSTDPFAKKNAASIIMLFQQQLEGGDDDIEEAKQSSGLDKLVEGDLEDEEDDDDFAP